MLKQANIKSCVEKRRNRREHRRYLCHDKEKPAGNSLHIGERSDLNLQVDLFRKRWRSGKRIRAMAKPRNFLHGRGKARKRCPKQANIKSCVEKRRNRREHRRYLCHGEEKPAGNSLHIGKGFDEVVAQIARCEQFPAVSKHSQKNEKIPRCRVVSFHKPACAGWVKCCRLLLPSPRRGGLTSVSRTRNPV